MNAKNFALFATRVTAFLAAVPCVLAENPIIQTIYTADPAPLVVGDTVYLYTGHDEDKSTYFTMKDWHVYSSKDMVNWTDHGSPLSLKTFAWAKDNAWAGQAIGRNGKFYWYAPMEQKTGGMAIGVAVGDSPVGPFKDALGKPLVFDHWGDIDPTVFIDDNGQACLAWGNPLYKYARLNPDMISYDTGAGDQGIFRPAMTVEAFGRRKTTDRPSAYEEGPWLYKRKGLYYLIYAAGPVPEHLAYAIGQAAEGPWHYGGVLMTTQGASFTNHPGVIDFKGHTYLFYHDGALPGGGGFTRSVCVEELKFNPDGSIPPVNMTREGPAPVATLDPYQRVEAETIAWESGVETEPCDQGGIDVTNIDDGDYIRGDNVDFGPAGAGAFLACVAAGTQAKACQGGAIELHLDKIDGPLVGRLAISYTGGSDDWERKITGISGARGVHDLFLVFKGEPTGNLFKFDYWQFAPKAASPRLLAINATFDRYKIDTSSGQNKAVIQVFAIDADGTGKDVTAAARIVASTPGIVSVSDGVVTGKTYGSTKLTIGYKDKTTVAHVIVKDLKAELIARSLSASVSDVSVLSGSKQPFSVTATYLDDHAEIVTDRVTCESADPQVATARAGVIAPHRPGESVLRLTLKNEEGQPISTSINIRVTARDPFAQNEAEDCNEQSGLIVENSSEGGKNLCDAQNGEWFRFNALDFGSGAKSLAVRVASATGGGRLEVRLDRLDGPLVGTCTVDGTGGWQNWTTQTCALNGADGRHDVFFKFVGGPGILFNVNWWKFSKAGQ